MIVTIYFELLISSTCICNSAGLRWQLVVRNNSPRFRVSKMNPYLERIRPYSIVNDALSQAQWAEKKWIWVIDREEGFLAGYVLEEKQDEVKVKLVNGQVRTSLGTDALGQSGVAK